MSADITSYLAMERAAYAELVEKSKFQDESFVAADDVELVVGSYAQQEQFDYERWLLGGLTIGEQSVALEYGCGPGRMLLRLSAQFHRVDGIDISPEVLDIARRRCAHLSVVPRLFLTDGQLVPVEADAYDLVYSVICLQHICVYAVRRRIFEGLYQALKPGGVLTFQMGYGPGHAARVDYFTNYVAAKGTNGLVDVTILHPAELASDLSSIGFERMSFSLTPTGPGDTHGAWIFFRAFKPGESAAVTMTEQATRDAGFNGVVPDELTMQRARQQQNGRGLMRRSRDEAKMVDSLRSRVDDLEQRLK